MTEIFAKYREASRHLRNTSFEYAEALSWGIVEDFRAVDTVLFQRLVLKRVLEDWDTYDSPSDIAQVFRIVPNTTASVSISTKPSPDGYSYSNAEAFGRLDAEIGFLGYYDHNPSHADFHYLNGVIFSSHKYPDYVGHYVLIPNEDADVFCTKDS